MNRDAFDSFCAAFPGAANVIQWGGASVWKVGGKVFAIHSEWGDEGGIVLKPSEMAREIWRDMPGIGPAPYLGRAGWIKVVKDAIGEDDLRALIGGSYDIVVSKLPKRLRP